MNRCVAIVGMNGVGKTSFGKRLASTLGMKRIDTDQLFEKTHGNTHDYIAKNGWETYRVAEEKIVLQALRPNHVVTLSGGAVESPSIRAALKDRAVVIWIQAGPKRIHKHLERAKVARPEFADGLHHDAVKTMVEARNPHYEDVADIVLFPSTSYAQQLPVALRELEKFSVQKLQ